MKEKKQCGICSTQKDLGLFSGMYCCVKCHKKLSELKAIILEGKYIIYQIEVRL